MTVQCVEWLHYCFYITQYVFTATVLTGHVQMQIQFILMSNNVIVYQPPHKDIKTTKHPDIMSLTTSMYCCMSIIINIFNSWMMLLKHNQYNYTQVSSTAARCQFQKHNHWSANQLVKPGVMGNKVIPGGGGCSRWNLYYIASPLSNDWTPEETNQTTLRWRINTQTSGCIVWQHRLSISFFIKII